MLKRLRQLPGFVIRKITTVYGDGLDVSVETVESVISEPEHNDTFFRAAQWCILVLVFLLPVWFLPITLSPVLINKAFLVSFLTIVSLLCYVLHGIITGRIEIPFHKILLLVFIVLCAWIVSAISSQQTLASLLGSTGLEINSALSLFIFFTLAVMISILFVDYDAQLKLLTSLGLGFLLMILMMFFFFMGWGRFIGSGFESQSFNTIGTWRSVALALGFYTMLLYPFLLVARGKSRTLLLGIFILDLIAITFVNFPFAWLIIGFFAVLFLSYVIWQRNISTATLSISLLLLVVSLFGYFSENAVTATLKSPSPLEVNVSAGATMNVTKQALKDHLLFGTGPSTFMYTWDSLKPIDVNTAPFWNMRFSSGFSYLLTMVSEVGLIGFLIFISFLCVCWYFGLRNLSESNEESRIFALSAFILTSYSIIVWLLYPSEYTLVVLGFIAIGFELSVLRSAGKIGTVTLDLFKQGISGFVSSLILMFLVLVSIFGIYFVGARYISQIIFGRAVIGFNQSGDINTAESRLNSAISFDKKNSLSVRTLAQIYLLRARSLAQNNTNARDLLGSQFKNMLDSSVRLHQQAIDLSPLDFENYEALGKAYEFLIPLGVEGASGAAVAQYDKALTHAPINPVLWHDKALAYIAEALKSRSADPLKKAEEALNKAIELKSNYTEAHFLLAQVFDAEGNMTEAVKRAEAAAILAPSDIGSLFQLGLLYYKSNRLADAEQVLGAAVNINPNYSNARYFLGLTYDKLGQRNNAIEQFQKIQELNPSNQEVETILANLRAGRSALATISTAPDKRTEPPVNEDTPSATPKKKR